MQTTNNLTCVTQENLGKAPWPSGLKVDTIPPAPTPWGAQSPANGTGPGNSTSPGNGTQPVPPPSPTHSGLGAGAIAGIAVGVAAALIVIAALLFWYFRRKRKASAAPVEPDVDLLGGGGARMVEPTIEPYRNLGVPRRVSTMESGSRDSENGYTLESSAPLLGGSSGASRPSSGYAMSQSGLHSGLSTVSGPSVTSPGPFGTQGYFPPFHSPTLPTQTSSDTKGPHRPSFASGATSPSSERPLPDRPQGQRQSTVGSTSPDFIDQNDAGGVADPPPVYSDAPNRQGRE